MSSAATSPIWLTAKTRMVTERRLRKWSFAGHLALTWYSFWLIVFSIWTTYTDNSSLLNFMNIGLSVLIFGLSGLFYGLKLDSQADTFRASYLDLQKIWRSSAGDQAKLDKYHANLDR